MTAKRLFLYAHVRQRAHESRFQEYASPWDIAAGAQGVQVVSESPKSHWIVSAGYINQFCRSERCIHRHSCSSRRVSCPSGTRHAGCDDFGKLTCNLNEMRHACSASPAWLPGTPWRTSRSRLSRMRRATPVNRPCEASVFLQSLRSRRGGPSCLMAEQIVCLQEVASLVDLHSTVYFERRPWISDQVTAQQRNLNDLVPHFNQLVLESSRRKPHTKGRGCQLS
jgi:hypothetical protein